MSRKQQLVELLSVRGVGKPEQLEPKTVAELEAMFDQNNLDQIRAQARKDAAQASSTEQERQELLAQYNAAKDEAILQQIFRTPVNSRLVIDNQANRAILAGWAHPGEQISAIWFKKVLSENPQLASQLAWQEIVNPAARRHQEAVQAKQDRETFSAVARELGLADNEANFSLVSSVLGPGLPDIRVSISTFNGDNGWGTYVVNEDSDGFWLTPATREQIAQWAYEKAKNREQYLKHEASPDELRAAVRAEGAARAANQQQVQTVRQLEAEKVRQAGMFPGLPETYLGQKLDARFIKRASTETLKQLIRRYGSAQITEAIHTRI